MKRQEASSAAAWCKVNRSAGRHHCGAQYRSSIACKEAAAVAEPPGGGSAQHRRRCRPCPSQRRTICPSFAIFLISIMSFFSCCCSPMRSRSRSRIARSSIRLFSRSSSASGRRVGCGKVVKSPAQAVGTPRGAWQDASRTGLACWGLLLAEQPRHPAWHAGCWAEAGELGGLGTNSARLAGTVLGRPDVFCQVGGRCTTLQKGTSPHLGPDCWLGPAGSPLPTGLPLALTA